VARKKQLIIPIFIPFGGCDHKCVFCNQVGITGSDTLPTVKEVQSQVESYLSTWKGAGRREVAFYGGSFTGLDIAMQDSYLGAVKDFIADGRIDCIRLSTRPDYIDEDIVKRLKTFGVKVVELGVQSFSDEVLRLSGRGHSAKDAERAVKVLKDLGMEVGLQLMPGLPGDTTEFSIESAVKARDLRPDFVRIYPTLVIKDTPLEGMYKEGRYVPWKLADMVGLCKSMLAIFNEAGVKVVKVGLHPTKDLEDSIVEGPYHRAFKDLVEGRQMAGDSL
jgi:histone acetyltransferase (RNA polymerase elongator complex component)